MTASPFAAASSNPFLAVMRFQTKAFKSVLEWQIEALDFYKRRIERDIQFVDELLAVKEPTETLSACTDFFQNALDDYSQEATKAASYGSRVAFDTADQMRHEAETLSEDAKIEAA